MLEAKGEWNGGGDGRGRGRGRGRECGKDDREGGSDSNGRGSRQAAAAASLEGAVAHDCTSGDESQLGPAKPAGTAAGVTAGTVERGEDEGGEWIGRGLPLWRRRGEVLPGLREKGVDEEGVGVDRESAFVCV